MSNKITCTSFSFYTSSVTFNMYMLTKMSALSAALDSEEEVNKLRFDTSMRFTTIH